ncbi:MAG: DUF1311 domain-containing protein [Ignavibacteria bacterium]|nr:DUF1311 domain-containing protein [Ignavibacteria bacterium]MBT8383378.1 DUF1311 domain-containing protein [Ignavibacteria bacterium]MBT8392092.1 DUF1311 domain-containing protein [Ignavibacteria bacterium]NNJ54021.1 DUF1311 domain-containing protein [Ignavibacteriaceae bacterium]NNL21019.1 DUF1311 domain-containing protein [Ignavibacteriaceae bacterium]
MKLLITGMLFILLTNIAFGQENETEKHPIDIKVEECIANESNQTTIGMINCIQTAMEEWDAELNKYYKRLMNTLNTDEQEKLRDAQRQWLVFRDKEFEFIGMRYGKMEGTMFNIIEADSRSNIVRQRALELKSYYDILIFE